MGYSTKISDPSFNKYLVNSNRWSAIFSCVLAVIAIAGFLVSLFYPRINSAFIIAGGALLGYILTFVR